jgi:hypothetical protein
MKNENKQIAIFFGTMCLLLALIYFVNQRLNISGNNSSLEIYNLSINQKQNDTLVSKNLFDQRQWVRGMIEGQKRCPEILVFGSSTVGIVSNDSFSRHTFLNAWLTGPTIEDYEAIFQLLHESMCIPKNILVGVDPWLFNSQEKSDRWKSLLEYYWRYQHNQFKVSYWIEIAKNKWSSFKENLSYVTTKQSVLKIWSDQSIHKSEAILISESIQKICDSDHLQELIPFSSKGFYVRDFDGHYESCNQFLLSDKKIKDIASNYLIRNTHSMASWKEFDMNTANRFEKMISTFVQRGSNVVVFSPAYHPITHAILVKDQRTSAMLQKMNFVLGDIAKKNLTPYLNFQDSALLGCKDSDFDDSHHVKYACMDRIVEKLKLLLKFSE